MVDFKKLAEISKIRQLMPITVYVVYGVHPESDCFWTEGVFLYLDEAEKAMEWLFKNREIGHGYGFYKIEKSRLTKFGE